MISEEERKAAKIEGERRRKAYIKKHPWKKLPPAPDGWDEPMKPKSKRRKRR